MRIIQLLAIAMLIWIVYRMWRISLHKKAMQRAGKNAPGDKVEHMVRCAKCGLHVPEHEALRVDDRFYCCAEHRDSDAA
ncbi:MAG TPA: hypothetical protein ENJ01_06460 [Gammaproteobacteria bacterium]|nr:hypothetical protein [Gammaproteobacteria bacterium]